MSSGTKDEDQSESDVSRFTLDGVVAEMVIEVEDNEINSSKSLKPNEFDEFKRFKSSTLKKKSDTSDSKEGSADNSTGSSESQDQLENKKSEDSETKLLEEVKKSETNTKFDSSEDKEVLNKNESDPDNDSKDVSEENKTVEHLEVSEKNETVEQLEVVEKNKTAKTLKVDGKELDKNLESKSQTLPSRERKEEAQPKKGTEKPKLKTFKGRPKNSSKSEDLGKRVSETKNVPNVKTQETLQSSQKRTRSSAQIEKSEESSTNAAVTRGKKRNLEPEKKDEVPQKILKSASEELKTVKSEKGQKSVSFSSDQLEGDQTKKLSLRKTTLLQATNSIVASKPKVSNLNNESSTNLDSSPEIEIIKSFTSEETSTKSALITPRPRSYNLSGKGRKSLDSFPEIKLQVKRTETKLLRYLYRILYGKFPPKDTAQLRKEILQFQGFSFNRKSGEYEKRRLILRKMPDTSIARICKILDVRKGGRDKMINNIMKFVQKPARIIFCRMDPFHPSMQPVLKLERIALDNKYLTKSVNTKDTSQTKKRKWFLSTDDLDNTKASSDEETLQTSKRKRFPSSKLRFYEYETDSLFSSRRASVTETPQVPTTNIGNKKKKRRISPYAKARKARELKKALIKQAAIKRAKQRAATKQKQSNPRSILKPRTRHYESTIEIQRKPVSSDLKVRRRALELAIEIQETESPPELESQDEIDGYVLPSFEHEPEIKEEITEEESEVQEKSGPVISEATSGDKSEIQEKNGPAIPVATTEDESEVEGENGPVILDTTSNLVSKENKNEDTSSEVTLSGDEVIEEIQDETPQKKRCYKTSVIPLKSYPLIKDNILTASFSALQRLHILLFGSSDKADNLKGNILSFGGFPFHEGTEEWKQKEFLLSLLSQNTLKEYLNLLCIKYGDEDQHTLITKLMKFLAAPIEDLPGNNRDTEVVCSEPIVMVEYRVEVPVIPKQAPAEVAKKKKSKKPADEKKPPYRSKKVLMDEAQVRRLEADLAREQRILERERRLHEDKAKKILNTSFSKSKAVDIKPMKLPLSPDQTDSELLKALLETVYQRRELKKAGAKISIPNKGGHTRLGELANVKFLVVTANYNDLDVLHHLIYMTEANKSRVRKNILDFAGFNFTEESPAYQDRMDFLTSLGYDISRRIAFLLGLCPYKTLIAQQDLNELIMYFLMSPCQSKQVPIRHLPHTFFSKDMPVELCALMQKHSGDLSVSTVEDSVSRAPRKEKNTLQITISEDKLNTSQGVPTRQKAKKSFKSSITPSQIKGPTFSTSTLPRKVPGPLSKTTLSTPQPLELPSKPLTTTPLLTAQQALRRSILKTPTSQSPKLTPQEFYIQQQTPDGQQKTYKLIKLPPNHPLNTVLKNQTPQPAPLPTILPQIQTQPLAINPPVIGAPGLPPGLIVFKNSPTNPALSTVMQTVPLVIPQSPTKVINPTEAPKSAEIDPVVITEPAEIEEGNKDVEEDLSAPVVCAYSDEEAEELDPLVDADPPTDDQLYNSIEEVIHSSNFENITLRNVIDRVSAEYPSFDLTPRHLFMKDCVKKIIMGT